MKQFFMVAAISSTVLLLSNCRHSKKAGTVAVPKMTYETNLQAVIADKCAPCHIPSKGGNKRAYDNFANVKSDIDEIIRRIELNPTDRGFMPFRKPAKLSDSTINLFKQWRTDGLLEK